MFEKKVKNFTADELEELIRRILVDVLAKHRGELAKLTAPVKPKDPMQDAEIVIVPSSPTKKHLGRKKGSKNRPKISDYTPAQGPPTTIFKWLVTLKNRDTGLITSTTIDDVTEEAVQKAVKDAMSKTHKIVSIEPYKEKEA
jgi:hypothetical protein